MLDRTRKLFISGSALLWCAAAFAGGPGSLAEMNVIKPSTTGIPGEELRQMKFDPQGNLWVAGRWPFWYESGIARLSADQVPHHPLPGGGFDTGAWEVWSNVHHPIPSAFISGLVFGANGVIWISSGSIEPGGGLTRFDPNAKSPEEMWFTYDTSNSPLILDEIYSLAIDAAGRLWMTNGHVNNRPAVFSFDPATSIWQRFDMGEELPWPNNFGLVNGVSVGRSGTIRVTHGSNSGFAEYDGTTWTLRNGPAQFNSALEDLQGNVWLTTSGDGLYKWNGSTYQHWPALGGTVTMTGMDMDAAGVVYVGTWYGPVYKFINGQPQFFVDADAMPYHIELPPSGDVWIGNYGGNGISGTVRHYTAGGTLLERINTWNSGLPDYFVDDIYCDHSGNLWFATGEAGISRMLGSNGDNDAPTRWRNFGDHNDLSEQYPWAGNEPMYSMFDDGDGTIWLGGNGVGRWNSVSGSFTGFWNWQSGFTTTNGVSDFARDANGDIWAGTEGSGIYRFNPQTNVWDRHAFSNPFSYVQERVFTIATDHDGLMWVGCEFGLHTFDGTTWNALHQEGLPFFASNVRDIEVGPDGHVWVCTHNGLAEWDGSEWRFYNQANGILGQWVRGVSIRDDGLVAVASFTFNPSVGGVSVYDGRNWTNYTTANSPLTHFQVEAVHFDADGDLWASAMSEGVVEVLLGVTQPTGDVTGDGQVNVSDLLEIINNWGACQPAPVACPADVAPSPDGDDQVNVLDLLLVINNWNS